MLKLLPDWLPIAGVVLIALSIGVFLGSVVGTMNGRALGKAEAKAEAAAEATTASPKWRRTMRPSAIFLLASVAACSCVIAGCQRTPAINGSGYQLTRFTDPQAALLASQDPTAGPAIASNNEQCRRDAACRK